MSYFLHQLIAHVKYEHYRSIFCLSQVNLNTKVGNFWLRHHFYLKLAVLLCLYIKQLIIAFSGYCGIQYSQAVPTTSPDSFQTEPGTVSENVSYSVHDLKVDFQLAVYKKV